MLKFPLQFLWLHSANYWFRFKVYHRAYKNYGNCFLLVTLVTILSAYPLTNYYTGSLTPIDICDSLHWYNIIDFFWWRGFLFEARKALSLYSSDSFLRVYARMPIAWVNVTSCASTFGKLFTTGISETLNGLDKLFYSDWHNYFTNHGSLRYVAIVWLVSFQYFTTYEGSQKLRFRDPTKKARH